MIPTLCRPYLALFALFAVTTALLIFAVDVRIDPAVGVRTELPTSVADWQGDDVFFCQNPQGFHSFTQNQVGTTNLCPVCRQPLVRTWSAPERNMFAPDTILAKKLYRHPTGKEILVTVVVSGVEHATIHRPQICLIGQGYEINNQTTDTVALPTRPLKILVLQMFHRQNLPDGRFTKTPTFYAYWFVDGQKHETPYHLSRMARTVVDRVIFGRLSRWAYVSVSGPSDSDPNSEHMKKFIRDLHATLTPSP